MHDEFIAVVKKSPDLRSEFECMDMVPWFQSHSNILETLPEGKLLAEKFLTFFSFKHELTQTRYQVFSLFTFDFIAYIFLRKNVD